MDTKKLDYLIEQKLLQNLLSYLSQEKMNDVRIKYLYPLTSIVCLSVHIVISNSHVQIKKIDQEEFLEL
ncbi:MAG: hypothetical protein CM15mP111_2380 [Hyphomicrobiales bacterium]|nr:MAG: hypothetical protein CM15mP111_2380 [Hyphomicrobiales bacterium]